LRIFEAPDSTRRDGNDWSSDPLSHPQIRNMTPEQLADLPFHASAPRFGSGSRHTG
jgi:hypothetical protein